MPFCAVVHNQKITISLLIHSLCEVNAQNTNTFKLLEIVQTR